MIPQDVSRDILRRKNVNGIGRNEYGGITVTVTEKLPENTLSAHDIVPQKVTFDGYDYDVDVMGVGDIWALGRKERHRPVPAGVSGGHPEITTGTVGSPPLLTESGETVTLTNTHVAAPPGETEVGDPFLQPGIADDGKPDDAIGEVIDWAEIKKDESNKTDSALVKSDVLAENEIFDLGSLAGFKTDVDDLGQVYKSGRTTGTTDGYRRQRDMTVKVRGYYPNTSVEFVEVTGFTPMSSGGDSGSLIGTWEGDEFYATHLLFAGSPQITLGIPIANVFEEHSELEVKNPQEAEAPDQSLWQKLLEFLFGFLGRNK